MATVLDRLRKRRCYPVTEAGEGIYVRSLTRGEAERLLCLAEEFKTDFILGCALTDPGGSPVFAPAGDETDVELCKRVKESLVDVDGSMITTIIKAVGKVTHSPPLETVAKN